MADLLQIEEPPVAAVPPPTWRAFLELGFRPLYLAGSLWAAVAIAIWIYAPQWLTGALGGVAWHAHEMLWGFVVTIALGFLLTAGSNWTGVNPIRGPALGAMCILWITARVAFLVPGATAFRLAALCELGFLGWGALALARAIYGSRNRRNYGIPLMVLALGVADALFLMAARQGGYAELMVHFQTGLLCMAVIALLVARRVIPFFAMRAVQGLNIPMHTRSGHWQLGMGILAVLGSFLQWKEASVLALAAAGGLSLIQLRAWKPGAVRHVPLLWILYVGHGALGAGLLVAAAQAQGWIIRAAWPVHVIAVAGFSVLIIGMVTRTALGHLGRPLQTDAGIVLAYALVIASAALRLLALLPLAFSQGALHASALAWILGFALYIWRFFPMMIRPRIGQADVRLTLRPGPTR